MTLARITGFRLVVRGGEETARFYAALGFTVDDERPIDPAEMALLGIRGRGWRRALRLGGAHVDLDRFEKAGAPYPDSADAASRCFQHLALVTDDVGAAWAAARAAGATPISKDGPVTLPASAGGVTAVKFRDPERHPLELIAFPDAAARGWTGCGVLGIDHSAIAATDLAAARSFYQRHGLTSAPGSLNEGDAQARLDGLDQPRVDVAPMRPAAPVPHVELLHYRHPVGAPCPDWSPADAVATRTIWVGKAAALFRDPDGHLHQIEASGEQVQRKQSAGRGDEQSPPVAAAEAQVRHGLG